MDKLRKAFSRHYSFLYDNADAETVRIIELHMIDAWDVAIKDKDFKKLVQDFVKARGDLLTSDREITAFMLAVLDGKYTRL